MPAPFGPSSAVIPGPMSKLTSETATTFPNHFETPRTSISASPVRALAHRRLDLAAVADGGHGAAEHDPAREPGDDQAGRDTGDRGILRRLGARVAEDAPGELRRRLGRRKERELVGCAAAVDGDAHGDRRDDQDEHDRHGRDRASGGQARDGHRDGGVEERHADPRDQDLQQEQRRSRGRRPGALDAVRAERGTAAGRPSSRASPSRRSPISRRDSA